MVNAEPLLQMSTKPGKAAGQNGGAVAKCLQGSDQPFCTFSQLQTGANPLQRGFIQPLQQGNPLTKAFIEIQLASHRLFGDFRNLFTHSRFACQLVNHFGLDQGRVHVEGHQSPVAAEGSILLEGDIQIALVGNTQEVGAHGLAAGRFAAH